MTVFDGEPLDELPDPSKPWFEQEKTPREGPSVCAKPYDFITVGPSPGRGMPRSLAESFDIFVNVQQSPEYSLLPEKPRPDTQYLWYPLGEFSSWGYRPFFWAQQILDHARELEQKVYLHCYAGVNRSASLAIGYLMAEGHSLEEAAQITAPDEHYLAEARISKFCINQQWGIIPENIVEYLRETRIHRWHEWGLGSLKEYDSDAFGVLRKGKKWV